MQQPFPYFQIIGPEGENFLFEVKTDRITIGRYQEFNDIGLDPDPQKLVTRRTHCTVEHDRLGWWVLDNSMNRTYVRRGTNMEPVHGRARLQEGDSVCILGKELDEKQWYWELTFYDPGSTSPAGHDELPRDYLEYDRIQGRLYRVEHGMRHEIAPLRPQEHKLIRYMDARNRANGNVAMCEYEELIMAVWGEKAQHSETDLSTLVWSLRRKIEPDYKNPRYLKNISGLGYRLDTHSSGETVS
jgi:DNA-binding winged helix-turn-helix (wHTH) protein